MKKSFKTKVSTKPVAPKKPILFKKKVEKVAPKVEKIAPKIAPVHKTVPKAVSEPIVEKPVSKIVPAPKAVLEPVMEKTEKPVLKELILPKEEVKQAKEEAKQEERKKEEPKQVEHKSDPVQERMDKMHDIISRLPGGKNFKK